MNWDWLAWSLPLILGDSPKKGPVNFVGWLLIEPPVFWPFSAARTQRTLEKIGELPRMTKEEGTLTSAVCWLYPICFLRNPTAKEPKAGHAQLSMQPVSKAAAASSFQWQWVWAYGFTNYCNGVSSRQTLASLRVNSLPHGSLVSPERDQGYRMLMFAPD